MPEHVDPDRTGCRRQYQAATAQSYALHRRGALVGRALLTWALFLMFFARLANFNVLSDSAKTTSLSTAIFTA